MGAKLLSYIFNKVDYCFKMVENCTIPRFFILYKKEGTVSVPAF